MCIRDRIRHYKKEFGRNVAQTIYEYGCLDCYDYDLYLTLVNLGVNTKPVKEYSKVLDWGCTYKHREAIRQEYVKEWRIRPARMGNRRTNFFIWRVQ